MLWFQELLVAKKILDASNIAAEAAQSLKNIEAQGRGVVCSSCKKMTSGNYCNWCGTALGIQRTPNVTSRSRFPQKTVLSEHDSRMAELRARSRHHKGSLNKQAIYARHDEVVTGKTPIGTLTHKNQENSGDGSWIDYFDQRKDKRSSSLPTYIWWIIMSVIFIIVAGVLLSYSRV